jgi:hypothetical protein
MRSFILSLRSTYQIILVVGATIASAFLAAVLCGMCFDAHQLAANIELSSSVYQVLGTVYAILLTFTLWGVWQNFNVANSSVQSEAYALLNLVHIVEASPSWNYINIRQAALGYFKLVVEQEWSTLKNLTSESINAHEQHHALSLDVVKVVQGIAPKDERELAIFSQTLSLLNSWLDARRTRILIARGDSAKALWPLLICGALVLFAFHGLFVAKTVGIWISLLAGFSLIIGLTFYLIFTLDCPFAGGLSIDSEPFRLGINILKLKEKTV